ncbi:MAG: hypothetical protein IH608_03135, partial [Proteobacteria bacterium]|nr:hypothetical protein [Pseudomonadota bacterium]
FFPLRQSDGLISDNVSSVSFAQLASQENFFLGFAVLPDAGLQFGRILSTSGLSLPLNSVLRVSTPAGEADRVAETATLGEERVWAATEGGLVEWRLDGETPLRERVFQQVTPVTHVAAVANAAKPAALFSSVDQIFYVESGGNPTSALSTTGTLISSVAGMTADPGGNIWVATTTGTGKVVLRYPNDALTGGAPLAAAPARFDVPVDVVRGDLTDIAVDAINRVVWLSTDQGAWFDALDAEGRLSGSWQRQATDATAVQSVQVDAAGNVWLGGSTSATGGLEALLLRLLTTDSSRYLGFGTPATVTVLDFDLSQNGLEDTILVTVNGKSFDFSETGDTGVFSRSLVFSESGAGEDEIQVTSSSTDTPVEIAYGYDPEDPEKVLRAVASWANIVDFEDDAWIGGPCFLEALGR